MLPALICSSVEFMAKHYSNDWGLGYDCFGYSVAISGDTAIVGAYGADALKKSIDDMVWDLADD